MKVFKNFSSDRYVLLHLHFNHVFCFYFRFVTYYNQCFTYFLRNINFIFISIFIHTDPEKHVVQGKRNNEGGGLGRVRRDPLHEEQGKGSCVGGNHHTVA